MACITLLIAGIFIYLFFCKEVDGCFYRLNTLLSLFYYVIFYYFTRPLIYLNTIIMMRDNYDVECGSLVVVFVAVGCYGGGRTS
jgi:hypothetical protein